MPQLRSDRGASLTVPIEVPFVDVDRTASSETSRGKLKPGPGKSAADVARHQRTRIHRAMIELVAEQGYDAVTVRSLTKAAGVSTRSFYQHYSDKQDCFWSVHELVVRRVLRGIALARSEQSEVGGLTRSGRAILMEWGRDPQAARLMLVEANLAGPDATMLVRDASRSILAGVLKGAERTEDAFVASYVVGGLSSAARSQLLAGEGSLTSLQSDLAWWTNSYQHSAEAAWAPLSVLSSEGGEGEEPVAGGDRSLLLSAISRLVATESGRKISLEAILTAAGVSRRCFHRHFQSADDALAAAMELHAGAALGAARDTGQNAPTPLRGFCRAIATFGACVARSQALAHLCFGDLALAHLSTMKCREQVKADAIALLEELTPTKSRIEKIALSASVGAIFENLDDAVARRRIGIIPKAAGAFAYFALAPLVGSSTAAASIREETDYAAHTCQENREWDHEPNEPGRKNHGKNRFLQKI